MSRVTVNAGVCGFITEIEALADERGQVVLKIESNCPNINVFAGDVRGSEGIGEVFAPFGESPLFQAARKHIKHTACPVPTAIMKSIEVSCGLALPRDVTIKVEK